MLKRFRCYLFGCDMNFDATCNRCGEFIYDFPGIYDAPCWLFMVLRRWRRRVVSWFIGRECDVCGNRYWRGGDEYTCSQECWDKWIPF